MRTHILLAGALCAAVPLAAQDTTMTRSLTLDVGLVNASGNSEFMSANFGEKLTWTRKNRWTVTQAAKFLYGETDGARTTESYDLLLRGDRTLSSSVAGFAFAAYQRDPFAGLASRWSGGPGVAWRMVQAARDTLGLDVAITAQSERSTDAVERTFGAAQTAARFKHAFASAAWFTQSLELIANLKASEDYRVNSETALVAPLSSKIGLRVSYLIRFDNQPEPRFKSTDRILTTGVQIAL